MTRSTRHGRRVSSSPVRSRTSHNIHPPPFPLFPSPPLRTATDANTLLTHVCRHLQSYPSSAYSLSTSSKQPSRFAPPQRPTLLSPRPQSPPRPPLHLAQNKASLERRRQRRQYGVAASQACYLLTYVFHRHHLSQKNHALSYSRALIHCPSYGFEPKKKTE